MLTVWGMAQKETMVHASSSPDRVAPQIHTLKPNILVSPVCLLYFSNCDVASAMKLIVS